MKIELQNEERIMVQLTSDDMEMLDITYEEMDYSNIETRRVIWTLLDEARRVLGTNIDTSEKMLIEALPDEDGGCVIYFSTTPADVCEKSGRRLVMKKDAEPMLFFTRDCDAFIEVGRVIISQADKLGECEMYSTDDGYYAIVRPRLIYREYSAGLFSEFGECHEPGDFDIMRITENGKRLSL